MTAACVLATVAANGIAQQQDQSALVRPLQSKEIITEQEAATIGAVASPALAERRLAELLLTKGVLAAKSI